MITDYRPHINDNRICRDHKKGELFTPHRSDRGDISHLESREQISVARQEESMNSAADQVREADVVVDGHRVHYRLAGSGPTVLLLHGLLAHSYSWRNTIPVLAKRLTAISPDLLGIGFSDRVRG